MGSVFQALPGLLERIGYTPAHLVHVGAHEGQEIQYYWQAGIRRLTLVEPIPELADALRDAYPDVTVVEAACGSTPGQAILHVPHRSNMATLQAPQDVDGDTAQITVDIVRVDAIQGDADALVIDAQGRELDVLASADLTKFQMVIVETCTVDDPTIAAPYADVVEVMGEAGFAEAHRWTRDYRWITRWARGRASRKPGEVRDVIFIRQGAAMASRYVVIGHKAVLGRRTGEDVYLEEAHAKRLIRAGHVEPAPPDLPKKPPKKPAKKTEKPRDLPGLSHVSETADRPQEAKE